MSDSNVTASGYSENGHEEEFNYRELIDAVILHWQWFVISVIICLGLAFAYLRYKPSIYASWTKVLIKEDDSYRRGMRNGTLADFSQLGILTNNAGFDNEIEILGSKNLAYRAVSNLKLYVEYYAEGRIRDCEIYTQTPILAEIPAVHLDTLSAVVRLNVEPREDGSFRIHGQMLEEKFQASAHSLPARIHTPAGWVTLRPNPIGDPDILDGRNLIVYIVPPRLMTEAYMSNTTIEPISKTTTIAQITFKSPMPQRSEDYLNELIRVYNEDANEVKNAVSLKTEAFVNHRIKIIDAELGSTEGSLEEFKKRNRVMDLNSDAEAAYKGIETYQARQSELETQMLLVKSLREYVENPKNYMEVIPVNLGINDASLNKAIDEYNAAVVARNRLLTTATESSPAVQTATTTIASLYPGIRASLANVYENLSVQKRTVEDQYNSFIGKLTDAPTQERVLGDIIRQQSVKATLYQILLQKREENAISLASTVDKAQVVDRPESSIRPVSPRRKIVMLIGLVLGIAIPSGILYLLKLLRFRIEGRNDIARLTSLNVLSDIFTASGLKDGQRAIVVRENTNNLMEEAFRNLRTNLNFVVHGKEKVIICTSAIPGEGKTFVSTNLAMSMALMGRHVLVVGLDIRKPRLARLFGLKAGSQGLTSYLAGDDDSDEFLRNQIANSRLHPNLDVLPAGLIPPNPGELILSPRLDDAFNRFRRWYDVIIVDTPPLGLVSDTVAMGRLADATLVVCRCDFSLKSNFAMINNLHKENKLPKMNLVLNGVDLQQRKYGYYYGYGRYGRYGHYGHYGNYGQYGHYGQYGRYGENGSVKEESGDEPQTLHKKHK